jgi:hypothetical protein
MSVTVVTTAMMGVTTAMTGEVEEEAVAEEAPSAIPRLAVPKITAARTAAPMTPLA